MLSLAAQGLTDKAISNRLGVSTASVDTYWGRIRLKVGSFSRTELVANWLNDLARETASQLEADNRRLFAEVSEHARKEEILQARLDLFDALIETHPHAILIVNELGIVDRANARIYDMFGYVPPEMIGLSVEDLVPDTMRERHSANRATYVGSPENREMAGHIGAIAVRKDGSEFPVAAMLSSNRTPSGLIVTCVVHDLASRLAAASADREDRAPA